MNWILRSYWSDQKYGTDEKLEDASGPASAFSAACTACSTALVQCSIRAESPSHRLATRATSPAAYTSGAASPEPAQTMPLSIVRPLPSSHSVFGVTPMPTTTTSASIREPSESATPATRDSPRTLVTTTPVRRSTPWSRCTAATMSPNVGPRMGASGTGSDSIRSEEHTSELQSLAYL